MPCDIMQTVDRIGLTKKEVSSVVESTLRAIREIGSELSVTFIGDRRMRRLNREHRGMDRTTDVLSFSHREGGDMMNDSMILGDVFISVPQIRRQAREHKISFKEECLRMLIHGVLHLAGYDHMKRCDATIMIPLQERILSTCLEK
jgi:probable rRNA maturation factor